MCAHRGRDQISARTTNGRLQLAKSNSSQPFVDPSRASHAFAAKLTVKQNIGRQAQIASYSRYPHSVTFFPERITVCDLDLMISP